MTDRPGALLGGSRLRQLISTIQQAAKKRNEIPKDEMKEILDEFTQYAYSRGLPGDSLGGLIDILTTPSKLDQATTSSIIKSLYPRGKVREDIAVKIVGCFGQGQHKPALNIQAHLLRWLVMVYNVLEGYTMLSQLYGVLFSLLDMITLRTHLCHLLSLLTRRKHVKPFRIQALLELKQVVGNEQALLGLLQIYKDYYPDVIVERLPPSKAGLFSHPNPEWIERLLAIQEANALNSSAASAKFSFQVVRKYGGQGNKRRKTGHLTVPEVRTYRAVETSVTLEEIGDVDDLVSRLDKLELPNQLAAVIEDPLLQQVLGLLGSDTDLERVNNWLAAYFSCGVNDWTKNYLKKVLEYTKYTKRLLPAVETFLELYLVTNNDPFEFDYVLDLLTFLPLRDFKELKSRFFSHLEVRYPISDVTGITRLIGFYTELLRYWIFIHGHQNQLALPIDAEDSIIHYLRHVGSLLMKLLLASGQSVQVCSAILTFYEAAASFPVKNSIFRLVLPPDPVVYHLLLAGDALLLSRLCGILALYKHHVEETRKYAMSNDNAGLEVYPKQFTDHLNGLIMDACNLIWKNQGLSRAENSFGCNLTKDVTSKLEDAASSRGEGLKVLYSLTRSLALAHFAKETFTKLELQNQIPLSSRHRGPLTQESLKNLANAGGLSISWRDFKAEILKEIEKNGLTGIPELMYSVISGLALNT